MPTNEEIAEAFAAMQRLVANRFRPGTLQHEQAIDRVTTAFVNGVPKFNPVPGKPNSLTAFAIAIAERVLPQVHSRAKPVAAQLDPEREAFARKESESFDPQNWGFLPRELQDLCFIQSLGFNTVDTALLLGISHQTANKRRKAAREMILAAASA